MRIALPRCESSFFCSSGNSAAVSGVKAGDVVVVNPPPGLLDGSIVKSIPVAGSGAGA